MGRLPAVKSVATLALGISFCGAAGYFFYLYFQSTKDDDYEETVLPAFLRKTHERHEMQIPRSAVRAIIGRNGSHIREIEQKSQAKINFKDQGKDESFRLCVITGPKENCHVAISLIEEFLALQPVIENEEIWVPRPTVGRIIGRSGEKIAHISRMSGAKIRVTQGERQNTDERQMLITGTLDQIERARSAILDIVVKDIETRKKLDWKLAQREPRGKPLPETKKQHPLRKSYEKLTSAGDGQLEVYLSAVNDPSQFWVQIVGPKANELDQLVEEMTEYYTKPESRREHRVRSPAVGDIVVAAFMYDGKYYRCEITQLNTGDNQRCVELYFLDYGDKCDVPVAEIYDMRTDFLQLRFQAIECFLAQVMPAHNNKWTDEATDRFEEWTQVAQWKKLRARISEYQDVDPDRFNYRARRATSPIPGVDLYDVNNQEDIDIAMELVKHGYAKWKFIPTFGDGEIMDDITESQAVTEDTEKTIDNATVTSDNKETIDIVPATINATEASDNKETIDIVPATITNTEASDNNETIDIVPATITNTEASDNKETIDIVAATITNTEASVIVAATINNTEISDNKETIDIVPATITNTEASDNKETIDIVPATITNIEASDNNETIDIVPATITNIEASDNKETIDIVPATINATEISDNKETIDIVPATITNTEISDNKETIDIVPATITNTEASDNKEIIDIVAATITNTEASDNKETIDIVPATITNTEASDNNETIDIVPATINNTEASDNKETIDIVSATITNTEASDNNETIDIVPATITNTEASDNKETIDIVESTINNTEASDNKETIDIVAAAMNSTEIKDNNETIDMFALTNDNTEIKETKQIIDLVALTYDNEEINDSQETIDICAATINNTEAADHKETIDIAAVRLDNEERIDSKETTDIGAVRNDNEKYKINQEIIDIISAIIDNTEPADRKETIDIVALSHDNEEIRDNKESTDIVAVQNDNDEIKVNNEMMVQIDNEEFIDNLAQLDISFNDNATGVTNGNKEEVNVIEEDSNGNAKFSELTERN